MAKVIEDKTDQIQVPEGFVMSKYVRELRADENQFKSIRIAFKAIPDEMQAVSDASKSQADPELLFYVAAAQNARKRGEIVKAGNPHDGWCLVVNDNNKYNYINANGKYITDNAWFDAASVFSEGKATVRRGDVVAVIDKEGMCVSTITREQDKKIYFRNTWSSLF